MSHMCRNCIVSKKGLYIQDLEGSVPQLGAAQGGAEMATGRTMLDLWKEKYPGYDSDNISYKGIARCIEDGGKFSLVHERHPAVDMLRKYEALVGENPDEMPKVDGGWIRIPTYLVEMVVYSIKVNLLDPPYV